MCALAMLCTQAWQQAQVELVLHGVKGVVGSPCEGKEFDITFRWAGLTCLQGCAAPQLLHALWLHRWSRNVLSVVWW